jgi:hypothetical protein
VLGRPAAELGSSLLVGLVVLGAAAVGWVRLVAARLRAHVRPAWRDLVAWTAAAAWVLVVLGGTTEFVAGGGSPHARYLMPAMPVVVVVLALGLDAARRRSPDLGTVVAAGLLVVDVALLLYVRRQPSFQAGAPGFDLLGHPLVATWAAPGLLVAGAVVGGIAVGALRRSDEPDVDAAPDHERHATAGT